MIYLLTIFFRMVRTAGGGARPTWANDYDDDEDQSEEEEVSEEEYSPSKHVIKARSDGPRKTQ